MAGQDPQFSSVIFLCPMSGPSGARGFNDFSGTGHTIRPYGDARIVTSDELWTGEGSGYFDGSGDYLQTDNPVIPASGEWTIEAFIRLFALSASACICSQYVGGSSGRMSLYFTSATNVVLFVSGVTCGASAWPGLNQWSHLAAQYRAGNLELWINGSLGGQIAYSGGILQSIPLRIGMQNDSTRPISGRMSDLRITAGTARYAEAFNPPSGPLVTYQYPDRRPGVLSGNARMQDGSIPDLVVVRHADTRTLAAKVAPDISGNWSVEAPPGTYDVTSFKSGCAPYCQGPYTVT